MPIQSVYHIETNQPIARDVYSLRLAGPTGVFTAPGQFVNLLIEGFYLRRPISVCDWDEKGLLLVYKIMGKGTAKLATLPPGTPLDVLAGLGNGFDTAAAAGHRVVLAGGGCGVPPLYGLAKSLLAQGVVPKVALGFADAEDAFYSQEFAALGCETYLATETGRLGVKGYVTNLLHRMDYDYYYTCGPGAMLQAVHSLGQAKKADGQLSFEERMGCGFGACMGCSCKTLAGTKRICVEGPVMQSGEVVFT